MLVKFHKRRLVVYSTIFAASTIIILIVLLLSNVKGVERWDVLLYIGFLQIIFSILALIEWNKLKKLKTIKILLSALNIMDISEMIIKRDATWFVEYWLFKTSGEYIGIIRPSIPWYAYPFGIFSDLFGLLIPITFHILDSDDKLIGKFRTSGPKIKTVVKIYDNQNELIGIYRQHEWRDLFNIRGELFDEDSQKILDAKVQGYVGNFKLNDINGKHWASFSHGRFPLKYKTIFKDTINPLIKINPNLTKQERVLLLSMVAYWFIRIRKL